MARHSSAWRSIPVLLAAAALASGCSDSGADRFSSSPASEPPSSAPVFLGGPAPVSGTSSAPEFASKTIGRSGGHVSLGALKVEFPKNALAENVAITIRRIDGERLMLQIEPSGLALAQPAMIKFEHLNGTDFGKFADVTICRQSGSRWVALPTEPDGDKRRAFADSLGLFALAAASVRADDLDFVRYLSGPGYETKLIEADKGGVIDFDRYKLTVPKDALDEDTYITVRNPGDGYVTCELEPHGIVFNEPVALEVDLKGLKYQPFEDWSLFWYDEAGLWEDMGGTFKGEKVTTYLPHFSLYRVARPGGRAGW